MKLQIEITRQDYMDFNIHHYIRTQLIKTIIIGITCLAFVLFLTKKLSTNFSMSFTLGIIITYSVLYYIIIYYSLYKTKNIPKENGSLLGPKAFDFAEDYIAYNDKDSSGQYKWTAIKSISESKHALYLYIDSNMAIVIPKRSFDNENHISSFRAYVREKINLA